MNRKDFKRSSANLPKIGDVLDAEVFRITDFGAFVKLPGNKRGLIHISQVSDNYVKNVADHLKVGQRIKARVAQITKDGKIDLSLKGMKDDAVSYPRNKEFRFNALEDKLDQVLRRGKAAKEEDLEAV